MPIGKRDEVTPNNLLECQTFELVKVDDGMEIALRD